MNRRQVAFTAGAIAFCFAIVPHVCRAQAAKKPARRPVPAAFTPTKDTPNLPRVLLLGDSISIGYTVPVREALDGKANVHRPAANCSHTGRGLDAIDAWLGDDRWDVIHFNWGLHDLKKIKGKHQIPLDEYEKNLTQLVERLEKTGARLVWCSTTPVPECSSPPRANEDVLAYNAVAKKIMNARGIAIDDLYACALPKVAEIQRPANVHFSSVGSKVLAEQVARTIREALEKPASK